MSESKVDKNKETASDTPAKKSAARTQRKNTTPVTQGCVYIQASYNNTIATATDRAGNVIAWSSAGHMGFKGPKKSTPYAATMVIKDLVTKTHDRGLREVLVFVRGIGSGREAAVRALNAQGLSVSSIKDVTPIPHNGCRAPGARRI